MSGDQNIGPNLAANPTGNGTSALGCPPEIVRHEPGQALRSCRPAGMSRLV